MIDDAVHPNRRRVFCFGFLKFTWNQLGNVPRSQMNKKSFFCGVVVGVLITWVLSFYLYYSLNSSESSKIGSSNKNIFNFDHSEEDSDESRDVSGDKLVKHNAEKSSYFKNKLQKEKEKRKLSRNLVEELNLKAVPMEQAEEFGIIKNVEDQVIL